MNLNPLFKPISPLYVWFWFVQLLVAFCIVGYWIQVLGPQPFWLTERIPEAAVTTVLFVIANVLIFRHRVFGVIGSVVCWVSYVLLVAPTF